MHKILIIDGHRNLVYALRLYFERQGYEVITAPNGRDVLDRFHQIGPDLVILDIVEPREGGWEVCRNIRGAVNNVPIIIFTAWAQEADRIKGLEMGADYYMTKPCPLREVVALVNASLSQLQ